ncbi:MAG: LamG protein, partial [Segetibacter sp.]|nr:LamG protein [Segetibacter sp.]
MAFVHHYPFDFKLLNDKGEDEFYLEDKIGFVNLAITNSSGSLVEIKKNQDDGYHFALKFRPGTLNSANGQEQNTSGWKISSPETAEDDGSMVVKMTYNGDTLQVKNAETLNIKFSLNIDGRLGTRSTNVLLLDNVSSLRKPRQINWTIINHRGRPFMPL